MLATFPFPKEAANIVRGDYANALFQMDINLNKIIKSPGEELAQPDRPLRRPAPEAGMCEALSARAQGDGLR